MRMDDNADAKRILLASLRQTGEDNQVIPASRGSTLSNRIWNNTTLHSPRQHIWLRTTSVEDDVDTLWCYAILELHARNEDVRWHI